MKAEFTPGPWEIEEVGPEEYWIGEKHYDVRGIAVGIDMIEDARLIAAAPEMYEALASIEDKVNDLHVKNLITTDEHGMILAALAKARGEQA